MFQITGPASFDASFFMTYLIQIWEVLNYLLIGLNIDVD